MEFKELSIQKTTESNFYYSFLFLPEHQRKAIVRVYQFCRVIDDVADSGLPPEEREELIRKWRNELDLCYEGSPRHEIMRSLREPIMAFKLPKSHFEEVIQGVEMDLTIRRYPTFKELSLYCHRVAGAVGLLCLQIFGLNNERYQEYAEVLAMGFQLTNILRDLKQDAESGRIYIPLEDLKRFEYSEEDLLRSVYNEQFIRLMKFQVERAQSYYEMAGALILKKDRIRLVAPEIMSAIYFSLLKRISSSHYDVFSKRIKLSSIHRLSIAFRTRLSMGLPRNLTNAS